MAWMFGYLRIGNFLQASTQSKKKMFTHKFGYPLESLFDLYSAQNLALWDSQSKYPDKNCFIASYYFAISMVYHLHKLNMISNAYFLTKTSVVVIFIYMLLIITRK